MISLKEQEPSSFVKGESFDFLIIGGTGLVGTNFIKEAQISDYVKSITVLSRHETSQFKGLNKVQVLVNSSSFDWPRMLSLQKHHYDVVFSAMGTTRGAAKSYAAQVAIDRDLNLSIAKVCKEELSVNMFVLASSFNNNCLRTVFPYFRMKHNIEQDLIAMGFNQTLILRPGAMIGDRKVLGQNQTFATILSNVLATLCYETNVSWMVGYSIKAEQVAQVAMYLIETRSYYGRVKYASSLYMLTLAKAIEQF